MLQHARSTDVLHRMVYVVWIRSPEVQEMLFLQVLTQSVSRLHLFQPPRADQMSDSDRQSQHPALHPCIHK